MYVTMEVCGEQWEIAPMSPQQRQFLWIATSTHAATGLAHEGIQRCLQQHLSPSSYDSLLMHLTDPDSPVTIGEVASAIYRLHSGRNPLGDAGEAEISVRAGGLYTHRN
jgi:hypothetical protein